MNFKCLESDLLHAGASVHRRRLAPARRLLIRQDVHGVQSEPAKVHLGLQRNGAPQLVALEHHLGDGEPPGLLLVPGRPPGLRLDAVNGRQPRLSLLLGVGQPLQCLCQLSPPLLHPGRTAAWM